MGTAHGSGLMLLPALLPLCMTDGPARAISALNGSTSAAAISRHMPQSDDTEGGTGLTFTANPDCLQALSALITIRAVLKTAVLVG